MVFVENVLLNSQNGKKSKIVRVFGIFKSDPGGGFLDPHKKSNYWTNFLFFFFLSTRNFAFFNLLQDGCLQNMDRFFDKTLRFQKSSIFHDAFEDSDPVRKMQNIYKSKSFIKKAIHVNVQVNKSSKRLRQKSSFQNEWISFYEGKSAIFCKKLLIFKISASLPLSN